MFNCASCAKTQPPKTKQRKVVLARYGAEDFREKTEVRTDERGRKREILIRIPLAGQIKREVPMCNDCANRFEGVPTPEKTAPTPKSIRKPKK